MERIPQGSQGISSREGLWKTHAPNKVKAPDGSDSRPAVLLVTREPKPVVHFPATNSCSSTTTAATQNAAPPRTESSVPVAHAESKNGKLKDLFKLIKPKKPSEPPAATEPTQLWKEWKGITPEQRGEMKALMESALVTAVQSAGKDVGMLTPTALGAYGGKVLRDEGWGRPPMNTLTLEQATAIRLYGREAYDQVNPWFWLTKEGHRKEVPAYMEAMRKTMEKGLSELPKLNYHEDGTLTVYRGSDFWPPNLKVGDTYEHWGFQSTSVDPDVVKTKFPNKYRFEIVLTEETGAKSVEDLTANKSEKEVLIPTGVCFRVAAYDETDETVPVRQADGEYKLENVVNVRLVPVEPDVVDVKPVAVDPGRRRGIGFARAALGEKQASAVHSPRILHQETVGPA